MGRLYRLLRPLLFLLPAEAAHHLGLFALRVLGHFPALCRRLRARALRPTPRGPSPQPALEVLLGSLRFAHPVALGAGLDKNGEAVRGLFALGFSSVEVGTVTPRPQSGNPRPRLFRLPEHQALINRMGFNNHGAEAMAAALARAPSRPGPLGINLGKNKDTPLEQASADYLACVDRLAPLADYVVVNASSPNTPGLRALQEPEQLSALLGAVRGRMDRVAPGKPLLLKFAPDLSPEAIDALVDVALAQRLDGLIATNTTLARPVSHPRCAEAGGLSGAPLRPLSTRALERAYLRAQGRLTLVGVGGVFTPEDVYEKIRAGASLVQVYTGFVYQGPTLVRALLEGLRALLQRDGFSSVQAAVGTNARG